MAPPPRGGKKAGGTVRLFRFILMAVMALCAVGSPIAAQTATRHLALELVPESAMPAAGSTLTLAIAARPDPGWHGYWTNPGDAGVPDRFAWTLPAGVTVGTPAYPVPHRLSIGGIMNYVYEGDYAMLVPVTVPAGLAPGTRLPIAVKIDYLVCTREICVPESANLSTAVTVGDGAVDAATRGRFDGWRAAMPRPLGSAATFQLAGQEVRIGIPLPAAAEATDPYFFPTRAGLIDHSAPQNVARSGDLLTITARAGPEAAQAQAIDGVLATGADGGLALSAAPGVVAAADGAGDGAGVGIGAMLAALGGAVLGGLILNIMPCVFPILSLKALSLAKSGESEARARAEAVAYSAGVIAVCLALGALLLGLRAGGASVGWAFQLTEPRVVLVLLLVTLAIALNLAGLFELGGSQTLNRLSASGRGGAFLTGALAAFIATPCTGPFMAGAMGAALVLPWPAALAVFAGLGLGIALPFLLIGFVPALRRRLPRPGIWMVRLRHILSVPMFLTALALAWVLGQQAGVSGMTLGLAAALAVALGLWWAGMRQHAGKRPWAALAPALAVAIALTVVTERAPAVAAVPAGGEAFSEDRLAALRAEQRPVFAYFTADWCLTCKVNEKGAIETADVRDAFARDNVAVLVGDWTDGDPALGRFIESHGRTGVPLYLYYAPGAASPRVLPQLLTQDMLTGLAGA